MLKRLKIKNFTVFQEADFEFADGLNVIVGENGAGKTHVLKLAYSLIAVSARGERESGSPKPTKTHLSIAMAKKLVGVFKPDDLGRLVHRQQGRNSCEVQAFYSASKPKILDLGFSFNTSSKPEVKVETVPSEWEKYPPVYLPTRELLTIAPGFVSMYENSFVPFEEIWRDTCLLLEAPLARGPREESIKPLLAPIEKQLGGKVVLDKSGRFYLQLKSGFLEAYLVAEGLRKLAMIARLIATGSLSDKGYLFWDEPEANLNPKIIKKVAVTILQLCKAGIQVFIASHSLFLMRELDILLKHDDNKQIRSRFFGLHPTDHGVSIQQGNSVDEIGTIDALQESLSQSDRYLEAEGI
ncbi:MAG: AAA family ATPase [Gemmatales bacterium]